MSLAQIDTDARDLLADLGDWFGSITTAGWVVVGVAVFLLFWVWKAHQAGTRLGAIEVSTLTHDQPPTAGPPDVHALTAELRRRLWQLGVDPPGLVPEGTPQADWANAIGEIAGPQGAAISAVLKQVPVPRPPSFAVTGTLTTRAPGPSYGLLYALQSSDHGPYLGAIDDRADHEVAVCAAAAEIYREIVARAPNLFPLWTRWDTPESLNDYIDGRDEATADHLVGAIAKLEDAIDGSPYNALAAMSLGNVLEQCAGVMDDPFDIAYFQVHALGRYMEVARLWPKLVEARYRTSVVAAALATTLADVETLDRAAIKGLAPIPGNAAPTDSAYIEFLWQLAAGESDATLQLLGVTYYVRRAGRRRGAFEPTGAARRRLMKIVRISRLCVRVRELGAVPATSEARKRARRLERVVRLWHLGFWRGSTSWQARYNAACFDALLLAGDLVEPSRRMAVGDRVVRDLDAAIREAAGGLRRSWVLNDPDFQWFNP